MCLSKVRSKPTEATEKKILELFKPAEARVNNTGVVKPAEAKVKNTGCGL